MDYSETFEQAARFARDAFELMERKKIPINPPNFTIWYSYVSGRNPALRAAVDKLVKAKKEVTGEASAAIYQRFFGFEHESAVLNETAGRIEEELGRILGSIAEAGDGAAAYGKTLATFSGKLAGSGNARDITAALTGMISATREMEERNRALEGELDNSSNEVSRLKQDLEKVRHEAMTDALTGIANRKRFDEELKRCAARAAEERRDLSLLMIDIDNFKAFNDSYGHAVGDQVLRLLAATLTDCIKGQDTAARYGGEEFSVILPATDLDGARKLADKLRETISAKQLLNRTSGISLGQITVSVGIARLVAGEPLACFVERADAALYAAKRSGRNRTMSETDLAQEALALEQ